MRGKRFKEEQIISILKEAQAGISVADLCRKYGICSNTIYNWKAKYGGRLNISSESGKGTTVTITLPAAN